MEYRLESNPGASIDKETLIRYVFKSLMTRCLTLTLIDKSQILSIQEALQTTIQRVDVAKASHAKLADENTTMLEYISNLMNATTK